MALYLLLAQGALGGFDTLYYHEYKLRLPAQPHAAKELRLHAFRDFVYALLFGTIGWIAWNGVFAYLFLGLLVTEIVITLLDFLEEDRIRKLPGGERVMHAQSGFRSINYGLISPLLTFMAAGVLLSGIRDLVSSTRKKEWPEPRPGRLE